MERISYKEFNYLIVTSSDSHRAPNDDPFPLPFHFTTTFYCSKLHHMIGKPSLLTYRFEGSAIYVPLETNWAVCHFVGYLSL